MLGDLDYDSSFPPRYNIHQYWARKPWHVLQTLVEKFTEKGDTVLDPFMGSAVICSESIGLGRNFEGIDLNPLAVRLGEFYSNPPSLEIMIESIEGIETTLNKLESELYTTICDRCNQKTRIINSIWIDLEPQSKYVNCENCKNRGQFDYNDADRKLIQSLETRPMKWHPQDVKMPSDSDVESYSELFSHRNLIALSEIFHYISSKENNTNPAMILAFTSLLPRASKMVFINAHRRSKGNNPAGVWGEKRYWIPPEHIENNVVYYFRERLECLKNAIIDVKENCANKNDVNSRVSLGSATNLDFLSDETIDFCFTDPPYGDAVRYLDLSTIWNAWITPNDVQNDDEVIPRSNELDKYSQLLSSAINEIYRVLKYESHAAITFQSTKSSIWECLLDSIRSAGFALLDISVLRPSKQSHNQLEISGSANRDIVILVKKSSTPPKINFTNLEFNFKSDLIQLASKVCQKPHTPYELYELLILEYSKAFLNSEVEKFPSFSLTKLNKVLSEEEKFATVSRVEVDYKGVERNTICWGLVG